MENISQNEAIRQHLEAGNAITPLEALNKFNCLRLGARIHNLKKMGLAIHSRLIESNGKRFAEYRMQPSELHALDRYAVADQITKAFAIVVIALLFSSCVSYKPGSQAQRRACRSTQEVQQYEHSTSAGRDCMRPWRNQWQRPHRRVHVPFTNYYMF